MAQPSARQPPQITAYPGLSSAESTALGRDQARTVFGQVMGLVALTLGCLALGACIGRDLSGGIGILFFVAGLACIFGLSMVSARGRDQLNHSSLRPRPVAGTGARSRPGLVREGRPSSPLAGRRGHRHVRSHPRYGRLRNSPRPFLVVPRPVLGAAGVARVRDRRDLRLDPYANVIWSVAGLVIFGGYTILDFNRLRRAGAESAVPIAASIFLDITNVFSFLLELFGGERD
jgi:hypothetical protein